MAGDVYTKSAVKFNTKRRSAFPGHALSDLQNSSLGVLVVDVHSQTHQKELTDSY